MGKRGVQVRCGVCRRTGHTARACRERYGATETVRIPAEPGETLLLMLRPMIRACVWERNFVETVALSCYLQGVLDGRRSEVLRAIGKEIRDGGTSGWGC